MNDALLVRRFQGLGDLPRDGQGLVERHSCLPRQSARGAEAGDPLRQILTLDQLHHERAYPRLP